MRHRDGIWSARTGQVGSGRGCVCVEGGPGRRPERGRRRWGMSTLGAQGCSWRLLEADSRCQVPGAIARTSKDQTDVCEVLAGLWCWVGTLTERAQSRKDKREDGEGGDASSSSRMNARLGVAKKGEARDGRQQTADSREATLTRRRFGRLRLAGRRRPKVTWG